MEENLCKIFVRLFDLLLLNARARQTVKVWALVDQSAIFHFIFQNFCFSKFSVKSQGSSFSSARDCEVNLYIDAFSLFLPVRPNIIHHHVRRCIPVLLSSEAHHRPLLPEVVLQSAEEGLLQAFHPVLRAMWRRGKSIMLHAIKLWPTVNGFTWANESSTFYFQIKMGKLLGFDYQRRWFCERNVWMCKVYGQCGGGTCC